MWERFTVIYVIAHLLIPCSASNDDGHIGDPFDGNTTLLDLFLQNDFNYQPVELTYSQSFSEGPETLQPFQNDFCGAEKSGSDPHTFKNNFDFGLELERSDIYASQNQGLNLEFEPAIFDPFQETNTEAWTFGECSSTEPSFEKVCIRDVLPTQQQTEGSAFEGTPWEPKNMTSRATSYAFSAVTQESPLTTTESESTTTMREPEDQPHCAPSFQNRFAVDSEKHPADMPRRLLTKLFNIISKRMNTGDILAYYGDYLQLSY